ncbi:hypothetical protein BDA96_01G347900 [Sorghum bicolor]|uniref:Uncharacterized protein n=2 Tax=Sorghum bicolor TaxID=4558 RepID=A0A921S392_SORBI|nr:hypothetical protein BDA96_01G347900 [Sorghum bicolor]OQU92297.1 hypothetical protein SORBI_3001G324250 [Sorghum bicolor]
MVVSPILSLLSLLTRKENQDGLSSKRILKRVIKLSDTRVKENQVSQVHQREHPLGSIVSTLER